MTNVWDEKCIQNLSENEKGRNKEDNIKMDTKTCCGLGSFWLGEYTRTEAAAVNAVMCCLVQ